MNFFLLFIFSFFLIYTLFPVHFSVRYKSVRVFLNISMSKNKEFSIKKEKKKEIEKIDKKKSY